MRKFFVSILFKNLHYKIKLNTQTSRIFSIICELRVEKPQRSDILVAVSDSPRIKKQNFFISPIGAIYFRHFCYAPMGLNEIFILLSPRCTRGYQYIAPLGLFNV